MLMGFVAAAFFVTPATAASEKAAMVNGTVISVDELNSEVDQAKRRMAQQGRPVQETDDAKMKGQILDRLIEQQLLYAQSKKEGIKIADKTIDEHLAKLKARFPSQQEFEKALKQMNLTEASLKEKTREGMAIQELITKEVASKVTISDAEVEKFYKSHPEFFKQPEQVKASHILIKSEDKDDQAKKDAAKKKIEDIQKKVKNGGDFASLAKEYSEGPSGKQGGDLGFFGRGQMVKPFEDAAFALEPGQVSDIVKTRFGYHLIKVTDKKAAGTVPLKDVKEKIRGYLKQQKVNTALEAYIKKLKEGAKIEKFI
jgi:peptidyl-prolyl cis-trans isomerase C